MAIYESGEDYLEQILIQQNNRGYARAVDIATALGVSKPSVSRAMKVLYDDQYIVFDEERLIYLTEAGRSIAEKIYERHVKLTAILVKIGVPELTAERDACRIEHHICDASFKAVCDTFLIDNDICILCVDDDVKEFLHELTSTRFCSAQFSPQCALKGMENHEEEADGINP